MDARWLIDHDRIRKISGSFSWIDHRFISGGFIRDLSREEILLYLFLCAGGDHKKHVTELLVMNYEPVARPA